MVHAHVGALSGGRRGKGLAALGFFGGRGDRHWQMGHQTIESQIRIIVERIKKLRELIECDPEPGHTSIDF